MALSFPVVLASDQASIPVTIAAGSAVIGHVVTDTGSTTVVTGNVAVTNSGLTNLDVALSTRTKPADQQHAIVDSGTLTAVTAITNALPAGAAIIGKVGIDQTTPGTTNKVSIGSDVVHTIVDSGAISLPSNAAQETGGNLATLVTNSALASTANNQSAEILMLQKLLYSQAAPIPGNGFVPSPEIPSFLGGF